MRIINAIVGVLFYLGVGALVHGWLISQTFDAYSVGSWGTLLAWPVVLFLLSLKWIGIVVAVLLALAVIAFLGWWALQAIEDRRHKRFMAKHHPEPKGTGK